MVEQVSFSLIISTTVLLEIQFRKLSNGGGYNNFSNVQTTVGFSKSSRNNDIADVRSFDNPNFKVENLAS